MSKSPGNPDPTVLLEKFLSSGRSEQAFASLMEALGGLVYSSALRRTGRREMAEEVAQNVFAILARKAASLRKHPSLLGWLYQTTKFEAAKAMQAEKRQERKLAALAMEPRSTCEHPPNPPEWLEALPILDEVMDALPHTDRELVLLRFFEGRKFRDIASTGRRSEAACKVQLRRVLDRLARLLSSRGVTLSATAITLGMTREFAKAAPVGFVSAAPKVLAASNALPETTILTNSILTMSSFKVTSAILFLVVLVVPGSYGWRQDDVFQLRQEISLLKAGQPPCYRTFRSAFPSFISRQRKFEATGPRATQPT